METAVLTSLPAVEASIIWSWFEALPDWVKKRNGCESEGDFFRSLEGDRKVLVYDDGSLLGYVSCEPKSEGIYEVHLFCPRKVPTGKLAGAISAFFERVGEMDEVRTLLFDVRSRQSRLGQILIENGCIFTGWSYYENGELFRSVIWQKSIARSGEL
jgi:hypothetical protein